MAKEYKFSIIIYIDNEALLETTVSSITSDKDFFSKSVQIVLVDSLVTKESTELCLKYTDEYPENIYFVDCQGKNKAEGFSDARVICSGSYLGFISAGDVYSHEALRNISEAPAFMKAPAICIAAETSKRRNGSVPYNFGVKDGTVNLKANPDKVGLVLGAYFFRSDSASNIRFKKSFSSDFGYAFILDFFYHTNSYQYTSRFTFTTAQPAENDIKNLKEQYNKSFFTDSIMRFAIPTLETKGNSAVVMNIIMYLIYIKLSCGLGERYMFTMGPNSVNDFFNLVSEAMQHIDDAVILNRGIAKRAFLPTTLTFKMLRLKYRNKALKPDMDFFETGNSSQFEIRDSSLHPRRMKTNGGFIATLGGALVSSSEHIDVRIMSIKAEGPNLRFTGYVSDVSCLDKFNYKFFAVSNREKIPFKDYPFYSLKTLFEIPFDKGHGFTVVVPLKSVKEMTVVSFFIYIGGMSYKLKFSFGATGAHLTEKFPHSYFVTNERLVNFDLEKRSITIRRATSFMQSRNERLFLSDIKKAVPVQKYLKIKRIRKRYHSTVDKYAERRIWLMCDSPNSTSEDARAVYDYISSLRDKRGIEVYYSQRGINPDDNFLMTAMQSTNLSCGSINQKMIAMNADVIVSNGHNVYKTLGFEDGEEIYYRDLLTADIVSFGDGLSMLRSAQFENKIYDNTELRFCGSKQEYDRLIHPIYGYNEKNLFAFGYPHLDSLTAMPSKQILVCPAMRRGFAKYAQIGYQNFTTEPLYSAFNSFITDGRLLSALHQNACTLVLILPNELAKNEYLWNKSDYVTVSSFEDLGYKETIEKSAMLITDYSNVSFDFAYMRKPVIYYQNPNVSLQYNISMFSYREAGFGEVVIDLDELVDKTISFMKSGFKVSDEYIKRRNSFFAFDDRNNCKRIANAIYDYEYNPKIPKAVVTGGFGEPIKEPEHKPISKPENSEKAPAKSEQRTAQVQQSRRTEVPQKPQRPQQSQQIHRAEAPQKPQRPQQSQQVHRAEAPQKQQRPPQSQQVRYAEVPQKPQRPQQSQQVHRAEVPQKPQRPPQSQQVRYAEAPQKPQRPQQPQQVRYAEVPQKPQRPIQPQRSNGGARFADPRQQTRPSPKASEPRRAAQGRTAVQRTASTEQNRSKQASAPPKHASPKTKKNSFRRF